MTDLVVTSDGPSWHPILNITDRLKVTDVHDENTLSNELADLQKECEKSLAHRVLAVKSGSCFLALLDLYDKLRTEGNTASMIKLLEAWCSLLNGQPDCIYDRVMDIFMDLTKNQDTGICLLGLRLICLSCIMHENNRQAFIGKLN